MNPNTKPFSSRNEVGGGLTKEQKKDLVSAAVPQPEASENLDLELHDVDHGGEVEAAQRFIQAD